MSERARLRAVVVDDEMLPRQRVCDLVRAHGDLELVGEAGDGVAALDLIASLRPDVVFLDIQMPELDGLQVAASLGDSDGADGAPLPAIVFVTAYDDYAIRAFEVDAIDYLLKPVTPERFSAAVARAITRLGRADAARAGAIRAMAEHADRERGHATRFVARRGAKHYFVRVADIEWIEADGNYVRVVTGDTSHLLRDTMKGIESRLDPAEFVRVHRSVIVAVAHVRSIATREHGEYDVTLDNGARFVSSRSYSERVRSLVRAR